jgi:shikimate dehydrogenase
MKSQTRPSILIGLIGSGISGSLSPAMHEREGEQQGLRYLYQRIDLKKLKLDVSALPDLLLAAERMGFTGLNITHPCKQEVVKYLDSLSERAEAIGAVNTVLFSEGRRIGYNTDGWGFFQSFKHELASSPHERVVLMGAGGAGTAIAHSMLHWTKASFTILDEDESRAADLADKLVRIYGEGRARSSADIKSAIAVADGFINATPVGMASSPGIPLDERFLRKDLWIAEIVYFPLETELLAAARATGCRVMDGGGMAVYQAAAAFRKFTGIDPDIRRMKEHFRALVGAGPNASLQTETMVLRRGQV